MAMIAQAKKAKKQPLIPSAIILIFFKIKKATHKG
jgi:hypothetical protein